MADCKSYVFTTQTHTTCLEDQAMNQRTVWYQHHVTLSVTKLFKEIVEDIIKDHAQNINV